ncbi:F-box domain-containing protein [Mycena sanguinolenta]|uniref:F-box domain-containing protein n=1 Tax=Mycena sanguinolenta TaxID=230812 RepID=A0A8H6YE11_9AGAR|nr:F-box domain-containing protein [Mycena sanguinolenta]
MAATDFSMHAILAQQTERTRGRSPTEIKQLIAESDFRVTSIQNEIAALESHIAALVERRDRQYAAGAALRFLVAPIRKLPVELLAEIFLLTVRESDEFNSLYIRDAYRVSHVCRHWTQVANGTPRLWTGHIQVNFHRQRSFTGEEIYANGLRTWLERSVPLSIPLSITGLINSSWLTASGSRLTEELLRIAPRWRSLWMHSVDCTFVQQLAGSMLDSLEELEMWCACHGSSHSDPTTLSSFTTAPRLRKVAFNTTCGIPVPWVQLTDITLNNQISCEIFLDIFSQCKNVVRASFGTTGWSVLPPAKSEMLALDRLRFLFVTFTEAQLHDMRIFDCLSAPALDELCLFFEYDGRIGWAEATFTAFQLRSPNITKFQIEGNDFFVPSNALITAFRHAPLLTHLSIEDCPGSIDEALLQALSYTDTVEPLDPRLHSLAVAEINGNFSQDGLADMIASRWWTNAELASRSRPPAVARWRQIRLRDDSNHSSFEFSPNFYDTMDALQNTGLDVDFVELDSWKLNW